jgi:hypothetical protein
MRAEVTLPGFRYPIREIFVGCCASAGKAVASKIVAGSQTKIFMLIVFTRLPYCQLITDY